MNKKNIPSQWSNKNNDFLDKLQKTDKNIFKQTATTYTLIIKQNYLHQKERKLISLTSRVNKEVLL